MPTDTLPSMEGAELIAEPLTNDPRVRRRYFAFLQKWRNWLRQQIGRSQTGNKDLADGGVDDLLALTLLVQFVRDRSLDAIQSLDQLPRCQGGFTLGQLCTDLQKTATCSVLKAVFDPARFANQCVLPTSVMERAFWRPIIEASRRLYGSRLPVAIFGDLHQWCSAFSPDESPVAKRSARSETRRYDKGIHYTPAALVNYLTSRVLAQALDGLSPDQILERRILDPSCGCGIFLVAALRYILARLANAQQGELSLQDRLNILGRMILGTDLDAQAIEWTMRGLLLTAWEGCARPDELPVTVPDLSQNIVARDFLTPAVSSANEGIDVILGGPPFVRLQQMLHSDPAAVERYKREFRTARSGQFDLYILFIEKAIDLLAPNGWLAFSVSNTFLRSETGRALRQMVGDECQVHDIIEFEDPKIYPDAVIQIALLLLQKSPVRGTGRHVWIRGKGLLREKLSVLTTQSPNALVEVRPLPPQVIRSDRWFFQSAAESDLLAKIQAIGKPLSRLPIHIGQGVVTGADHVFLFRKVDESNDGSILVEQRNTGLRFAIESPMLRPIIRNRDIDGYAVPSPVTLCLVPYDSTGRLLNEIALCRDFPRAHQYLLANKNQLATGNRKRLEAWYAFTSTAALRVAASTKVIGGLITSGGDMTIVPGSDLCHGGVLSMTPDAKVIDPYYLLAICNSSIFWAFVQHKMPTMGIGRHTIRLERLRQFPLVVPGSENQSLAQAIAAAARNLMADTLSPRDRPISAQHIRPRASRTVAE
ncbi:MAG: SAM-dependent DNA methyltransferase [Planctomycetes bacterium]|nr:SAM-dependent DNA methyltransferase [Planctomycetota bacterium]